MFYASSSLQTSGVGFILTIINGHEKLILQNSGVP